MKLALDAMGGDHAPAVTVTGAVEAARELGVEIILVGIEETVRQELAKHKTAGLPISVVHAPEVLDMTDHAAAAARSKRDSSMAVGTRLVKDGQVDAFITCGNTGGALATGLFVLGRIQGIKRPALTTIFPSGDGFCLLLDIGANTEGKGNELVKETYPLLKADPGIHFVGNVEGKDIVAGMADVIVTDGFTGNVVIKLAEGLAKFMVSAVGRSVKAHLPRNLIIGALPMVALAAWQARSVADFVLKATLGLLAAAALPAAALVPGLMGVRRRLDYAEYGAAPLLGLDGLVLVGHGRSNVKAVRSALRMAKQTVEAGTLDALRRGIAERTSQSLSE